MIVRYNPLSAARSVAVSHRETYRVQVARDGDGGVMSISVEVDSDKGARRSQIAEHRAAIVAGHVHDLLRSGGVSERRWAGGSHFEVEYLPGAHIELLLVAVRPVRLASRASLLAQRIAAMSIEEASYWHAKIPQPGGLPALRLLLTAEDTRAGRPERKKQAHQGVQLSLWDAA